jgi:hypothetical protein
MKSAKKHAEACKSFAEVATQARRTMKIQEGLAAQRSRIKRDRYGDGIKDRAWTTSKCRRDRAWTVSKGDGGAHRRNKQDFIGKDVKAACFFSGSKEKRRQAMKGWLQMLIVVALAYDRVENVPRPINACNIGDARKQKKNQAQEQ